MAGQGDGTTVGGNPVLQTLLNRMMADPDRSSMLSEYTKTAKMTSDMRQKRFEFTVENLRIGSQLSAKQKQTPRAAVFTDQIRLLEEKMKADLGILEDMQEFARARAKLEAEHALSLQRLAQQFHSKRKWPPLTYSKGHENILLIDLWRSVLGLTMDDAKGLGSVAERLTAMSNEDFDRQSQQKRADFRTAQRVLERLQDELFGLDVQVAETKSRYDAALKQSAKLRSASRKRAPNAADLRKCEASCEFARHQYLLEVAAANGQYTKFRNEQIPEVMDAATAQNVDFYSKFLKQYTALFGTMTLSSMKNLQKMDQLASELSPRLERRTFLHKFRAEFPGRQLFEREQAANETKTHFSYALTVDDPVSRHTLVKMRGLLMHTCRTIDANQDQREKQMQSLQSLLQNYLAAGSMFDAEQPKMVKEKMVKLHSDIEDAAMTKFHLETKVQRLTEAGIDEDSVTPLPEQVLDLDEARARDSERRALTVKPTSEGLSNRRSFKSVGKGLGSGKGKGFGSGGKQRKARQAVTAEAVFQSPRKESPSKENPTEPTTTSTSRSPPPIVVRRRPSMAPTPPHQSLKRRIDPSHVDETLAVGPQAAFAAVLCGEGGSLPLPPPPTESELLWSRRRSTLLSPPPPPPPPALLATNLEDTIMDLPPPPAHIDDLHGMHVTRNRRSWALEGPIGENIYEKVLQAELPPRYKALYPYIASQDDDISLQTGESTYVLVVRDDGWCLGLNMNGQVGYFPAAYVEKDDEEVRKETPTPRLVCIAPDGNQSYGFTLLGSHPPKIDLVSPGGAAAKAGLLPGDLVLESAGEPCSDLDASLITEKLARTATLGGIAKLCVIRFASV